MEQEILALVAEIGQSLNNNYVTCECFEPLDSVVRVLGIQLFLRSISDLLPVLRRFDQPGSRGRFEISITEYQFFTHQRSLCTKGRTCLEVCSLTFPNTSNRLQLLPAITELGGLSPRSCSSSQDTMAYFISRM